MEARNFHTSLVGGFRKKDVIRYLAEEKLLQEEQLSELRRQQTELEEQLDQARTDGGANRLLNQELQSELEQLRLQLEQARDAQARAEEQARQFEDSLSQALEALTDAQGRLAAADQQDVALRRSLEQKIDELQARLAEAESRPLPPPADTGEADALREALARERRRADQLEEQLCTRQPRREEGENADQLWALCGKMERTIRQMERMLDGPYHMTCYPKESYYEQPRQEAAPAPEPPAQPEAKPSVSSLLQRVRGK